MVPAEVGVEVTPAGRLFEHLFEQEQRYTAPPTRRQPLRRILGTATSRSTRPRTGTARRRPRVEPDRHTLAMRKALPLVLGGVMVVIGLVWTLQGLGYVSGSPMTGVTLWAVVGPVVAVSGLALLVFGMRERR